MFIKNIDYSQFVNKPNSWTLVDCSFGNINLITGRNATGKTKLLNVIGNLANLLSGYRKLTYQSGYYNIKFNKGNNTIEYILGFEETKVIQEHLSINNVNYLDRGPDGIGTIHYKETGKSMKFQTPQNELASVARRDSIQHPFLEDLYIWGDSTRRYSFGTNLGRQTAFMLDDEKRGIEKVKTDTRDQNQVVGIFLKGREEIGKRFITSILKDMKSIGYHISEIGTAVPEGIIFFSKPPGEVVQLYIREKGLNARIYQHELSQGMFRALSLIIQITYSLTTSESSCILIDDIGEGLDFERSSSLVKLLIARTKNSPVQLIMATNDRFIMNNVPLEYWSIIQRTPGKAKIYNYRNSKELFNSFELLGLNNFDFFSSNYYLKDYPGNEEDSSSN